MRLEGLIAVRYLFAHRQRSVANTISWVSLIGLLVSTAALIVVLSVYNGIGELTKGLFSTFDPELIVEPAEGKTFHLSEIEYEALCALEGIETVAEVVEETAWLTYGGEQAIVSLRGVDQQYASVCGIDTLLHEGTYNLEGLVVGGELWLQLGMGIHRNTIAAVHIPWRGSTTMGLTLDQAFNTDYALPAGTFFIQQDIDRRYVLTSIERVRQLTDYAPDECTALAIKLKLGANVGRVKAAARTLLSAGDLPLTVKDRYDQQPLYFKIFRTERIGIYLILSLIVMISTLSLAASLSLLVINKRQDIFTLRSLGMTRRQVRRSFAAVGWLICGVAVVTGLAVGFVVCYLQQQFGLVRMGDGNFVVSAFPVAMRAVDFLITFCLVMAISGLTVMLTVRRAKI